MKDVLSGAAIALTFAAFVPYIRAIAIASGATRPYVFSWVIWAAELYVSPAARGGGIGRGLLDAARKIARERGWKRLEVTTPPLPQFQRTLDFYRRLGFAITGGRKLKTLL